MLNFEKVPNLLFSFKENFKKNVSDRMGSSLKIRIHELTQDQSTNQVSNSINHERENKGMPYAF